MTTEEFQTMIIKYIGCKPIFVKTGTKPSFSGWTIVTDGYYDVTSGQEERARALSDELECGLYTIYRYANGTSCPHQSMYPVIERAIERIQSNSSSTTKE